eukprot:Nitzschia sp. Nitz4//scaffold298_size22859//5386//7482//NITZ4_008528-RA/size22859-snap-gene-0.12-mRNA-1//1//CDS//3329546320//1447//frame0
MTTTSSATLTPKGTVLAELKTFAIVPFWKGADTEDKFYAETLAGFRDSRLILPFQTAACQFASSAGAEYTKFLSKLFRDDSFESLVVLATFEIVLGSPDSFQTNKDVPPATMEVGDVSLLVEGWPFIQETITWNSCLHLYQRIWTNMHRITLPHPISEFATARLPYMPHEQFREVVQAACDAKMIPQFTENYLQACQYFLDYVASLPPRIVGILFEDPLVTSIGDDKQPSSNKLIQSCVPSATLECTMSEENAAHPALKCSVVALYDLSADEVYTVSTRPTPNDCTCGKCQYTHEPPSHQEGPSLSMWKEINRSAHQYFQQGDYAEAKKRYQWCFDCNLSPPLTQTQKAELWHAMGALELSQLNFIAAQRHWREGKEYASVHSGIELQLEKQNAYEYFTPLPTRPESNLAFKTVAPLQLQVTPNLCSVEECQQVIDWAQESAGGGGGWTTSRHYAVPTTDIPVHQCPTILSWFQRWMSETAHPLLQKQFQTKKRFFVHDAFVAKYTASDKNRFLPMHFDESTHSMVLALNDEYEGGGSYFFTLDETILPCTGSLVSFRGNTQLHGGNLVTKGTRFILAVFMYLDDEHDEHLLEAPQATDGSRAKKMKLSVSQDNMEGCWNYVFVLALELILVVLIVKAFPVMEVVLEAVLDDKLRKGGDSRVNV